MRPQKKNDDDSMSAFARRCPSTEETPLKIQVSNDRRNAAFSFHNRSRQLHDDRRRTLNQILKALVTT
jgi:hypothetical protein